MIDANGFRQNVGIILSNDKAQLFWAKRIHREAWQFPQGGIQDNEQPIDTLYRELYEEVGLKEQDVQLLHQTRHWLNYRLPRRMIRNTEPRCIGQKQIWFMLKLNCSEERIAFDRSAKPEFDDYRWVNYWFPLQEVVSFKREVYRQALKELAPAFFKPYGWDARMPLLDPLI